jgi:hypothetical protein
MPLASLRSLSVASGVAIHAIFPETHVPPFSVSLRARKFGALGKRSVSRRVATQGLVLKAPHPSHVRQHAI